MIDTLEPGYRVLLLYSESRLTPSVVSADQALRSTLEARSSRPVHFYTEFLDLNASHGASLQGNLRELVGLKYRARRIDLIVAQGQLSVPFTLQNRVELFSRAPIVFIGVEPSTFVDLSVEGVVTGTWRRRGWAETLDLARRLHPGTRRATVLVGSSMGERLWMEAARQQLAAYVGSIEISYLIDRPFEDVLQATAALPKDTVVLAGPFLRDGTGRDFATPAAIGRIAAVSGMPVYVVTESCVGTGAVGGYVVSFEAHGKVAADLALRVLAGERPSPTDEGTTLPMFDDRQVKRWRIDRRLLPAGSVALFREPPLWERYGRNVAAALGLPLIRRRPQKTPNDYLGLETLLSDISAVLTSCAAADVDRHVDAGLRRIVEALGVDRAAIWALADRSDEARLTHSWSRESVPSLPQAILENDVPRIFSGLRLGAVVRSRQSEGPPDDALIDRQTLARFGTRSSAVVPLFEGGSVVGGLAVDTVYEERDWPDELLARLRLLSDIFANARARQRAARTAQESAEQIRELAGRLMTSQEEERRRIARELHDGVNQDLAALSIALNALEDSLPEGIASKQRQEVARLQGRIVELTEAVRHLSHELHPGILQYGGLAAALRSHCREFEQEHGLTATFQVGDDLETIPHDVALCLYRVTQEALKNAARHAKPSRVWVALGRDGADLVLTIGDDGIGFDLAQARGEGGLGLISLDERIRLVRGRLTIDTQPQRGTEIHVAVPLPEARNAPPDDIAR